MSTQPANQWVPVNLTLLQIFIAFHDFFNLSLYLLPNFCYDRNLSFDTKLGSISILLENSYIWASQFLEGTEALLVELLPFIFVSGDMYAVFVNNFDEFIHLISLFLLDHILVVPDFLFLRAQFILPPISFFLTLVLRDINLTFSMILFKIWRIWIPKIQWRWIKFSTADDRVSEGNLAGEGHSVKVKDFLFRNLVQEYIPVFKVLSLFFVFSHLFFALIGGGATSIRSWFKTIHFLIIILKTVIRNLYDRIYQKLLSFNYDKFIPAIESKRSNQANYQGLSNSLLFNLISIFLFVFRKLERQGLLVTSLHHTHIFFMSTICLQEP